ncbi:MAG: class I SAM-dependent methyltransferase [Planctomycetia bacterium]|jgi:SAM-dependent methyltransferase|nr:class I SAM-dependent methyltransferase [Planctomycetia bacterium]
MIDKSFHRTNKPHADRSAPPSTAGQGIQTANKSPLNTMAKSSSHWGHVGEWYDDLVGQDGTDHHQKLIIPGVLRMLNVSAGEYLLDVACGQGVLCRAAARDGVRTVGVDMAASLVEAANRRRTNIEAENYYCGDARNLAACAAVIPGQFDAAACILAIANLTPLSPVWRGIYNALKPGGKVVVVLTHPCFRIPQKTAWQWDQEKQTQHRLVDSYLTSEKFSISMHPGRDPAQSTTTFHRPLQAYINTMGSAGLWIDHIEEWSSDKRPPHGARFSALDHSRREIPLFLALRAIKAR